MTERNFSLADGIYIVIFLILLYLVITAWDDVLDEMFARFSGLDKERDTLFYKLALAFFVTVVVLFIFFIINEDVRYLFAIAIDDTTQEWFQKHL